jgi:hypothetical protein
MRATTIALRAVLLLVIVPASLEAAVVRVPDDEPTIQEGVLAASEGDTVLVAPDTYTGPMNRNIDFGGKNIVLLSEEGAAFTIIDCGAAGRGFTFSGGENSTSVVRGFRVITGSTDDGGAVYCENSSPTFRACVFEGNRSDGVGGAMSCYASSAVIKDCVFLGNSSELALEGAGGGIYCAEGSALTVSGCTFTGNASDMGGAFACTGGSSVAIATSLIFGNAADSGGAFACRASSEVSAERCTMSGNIGVGASGVYTDGASTAILDASIIAFGSKGEAVLCQTQGTATLTCCDVYQNEYGDWTGCIADQSGIDGNMSADPLFCWAMNPKERYSLRNDSPCASENNPGCGGIGAFEVGCYVTSVEPASWSQLKALYQAE